MKYWDKPEVKAFEEKFYHKRVRIISSGIEGTVTAAMFEYEEDGTTILALLGDNYSAKNPCWYTCRISKENFEEEIKNFEII